MIASSSLDVAFEPSGSVLEGTSAPECRACVAIPVCNEEGTLSACLDALDIQVDVNGRPLPKAMYEVLLLLNNCTDHSREVAKAWHREKAAVRLLLAERAFATPEAHAGTARRLAMDTAWHRLRTRSRSSVTAIMTTDADSVVAPDWIARNLAAVEAGADAVGGLIRLREGDLANLPQFVRHCYAQDRRYAALIAKLEDLLDPQAGDAAPRHLDHFGSSLACTPGAYAACGGMPALPTLEDEAFVDRLRRVELKLRHDPKVVVTTSARLEGRATVGLAGQLRFWSELHNEGDHVVRSAAYLRHRFSLLHALRLAFSTKRLSIFRGFDEEEEFLILSALHEAETLPAFLIAVDSESLVSRTFLGALQQPIQQAIQELQVEIAVAGSQQFR